MAKKEIITMVGEYGTMDYIVCMECKTVPCVCDKRCMGNCGKPINIHTDPYCIDCMKKVKSEIAEMQIMCMKLK